MLLFLLVHTVRVHDAGGAYLFVPLGSEGVYEGKSSPRQVLVTATRHVNTSCRHVIIDEQNDGHHRYVYAPARLSQGDRSRRHGPPRIGKCLGHVFLAGRSGHEHIQRHRPHYRPRGAIEA